jgi:hypothetical protein
LRPGGSDTHDPGPHFLRPGAKEGLRRPEAAIS